MLRFIREKLFLNPPGGSNIDEAIKILQSKIATEGTYKNRIVEPFEITINPKSITVSALKFFGSLPFEVIFTHLKDGRLVLSTGSKNLSLPDYGLSKNSDTEFLANRTKEMKEGDNLLKYRLVSKKKYTMHNHPTGIKIPTPNDFSILGKGIVLSKEHICEYTVTDKSAALVKNFAEEHGYAFENEEDLTKFHNFLIENRIISIYRYDDPETQKTLELLRK